MNIHETSIAYSGDSQRAMDMALQTLLPLGFQIESQGSAHLIVSNSSYNSTRQSGLKGISRAEFNAGHSTLSVRAELGGVERLQRFLLFLLLGVGVFDTLMLTGLWYFLETLRAHTWFLAIPILSLLPWVFIAPRMTVWIRQRTLDALDILLSNMAGNL